MWSMIIVHYTHYTEGLIEFTPEFWKVVESLEGPAIAIR